MGTPRDEYGRALDALARALAFGIHPSLDGIRALADALGRPQDAFVSIQVTGTNGKTSTARLLRAVLASQGRAVGLYTSPHLERYPERIEIGGEPVGDGEFAAAVLAALDAAELLRPGAQGTPAGFTEFELLTAAALWLFRERRVEFAVLEVGLGGTWDSTSVVDPAVAVITGVGLDHVAVLGDTLEEIAAEKAGIIKRGSVGVLGPGTAGLERVFLKRAQAEGVQVLAVREHLHQAPLDERMVVRFAVHRPMKARQTVFDVHTPHADYLALRLNAPAYQAANAATALTAAERALGAALDRDSIRDAFAAATFPGRFEVVRARPLVIVDGSHNPQAATVLADAVLEAFPPPAPRPRLLLGVLADKDVRGIAEALAPVASSIAVVTPDSPRALEAASLASIVEDVAGVVPEVFDTVAEALESLLTPDAGPLLVTGSLTTAGEARRLLRIESATGGT